MRSNNLRAKEVPFIKVFVSPKKQFYSYNEKACFDLIKKFEEAKEKHDEIVKLVENNRVTEIVDFDDHFEDVNLDWRNNFIN